MEHGAIVSAWDLSGPVSLRDAGSGTNNRTRFVDTAAGSFVLRVYVNTRDARRVRYEHDILLALQAERLPFSVPCPVLARGGETFLRLEHGSLAALFPLLPGEQPDRTNIVHVRACGDALAALHVALRRVDVQPPADLDLPTYGNLERIHPLVPDPWSLPRALPLAESDRASLLQIFSTLRPEISRLYAALPMQLCHNDYSPGNTLFVGDRLGAILDFEFAGPDLRAIDVAVGWFWSVRSRWWTGTELGTIRAFLEGYASIAPLTQAELEAMPSLVRIAAVTSLVHWTGRHRAGLATDARLAEQIERLLDLDRWLTTYAAAFSSAISSIVRVDSTDRPSASTSFSVEA